MKILQVFDLFSPQTGGGTVDVISKISQGLIDKGHEVTLCTSDYKIDIPYIKRIKGLNIDLHHNKFKFCGIYFMPDLLKINVQKYDVIHLNCFRSFQNIVLCRKARKYGVPYIIDAHGSTSRYSGIKKLFKLTYDNCFGYQDIKHASKFIAENELGAKEYERYGIPKEKIAIIHPPFDLKEFENLPPKDIDESYILFIGRIHKAKGLEFLVRTISLLRNQKVNIHLIIAGTNDGYKNKLIDLIIRLGLEDYVHITDYVSGENKLTLLVNAKMLIQPSYREAGARPSFEAIMCNTPVIATRGTGAGLDIWKANCENLVEYGNTQDLADTIKCVLDNPARNKIKIENGQRYIKDNLSIETIVEKYEKVYKEILK